MKKYLELFLEESAKHLSKVERLLSAGQTGADSADELFRVTGAARAGEDAESTADAAIDISADASVDLDVNIAIDVSAVKTLVLESDQDIKIETNDGIGAIVITGAGDVLEPEHGIAAIGSGGNFALAAARGMIEMLCRWSPSM